MIIVLHQFFHSNFNDHISKNEIEEILDNHPNTKIIILRRSLIDSYKSLVKALQTGNWGTTPLNQKENKWSGWKSDKIPSFQDYEVKQNEWFDYCDGLTKRYNLPTLRMSFEMVINSKFEELDEFME